MALPRGDNDPYGGTYFLYDRTVDRDMDRRRSRYLDLDTANAVRLGVSGAMTGCSIWGRSGSLWHRRPSFWATPSAREKRWCCVTAKRKRAGPAVLYYRANATGKARGRLRQSGQRLSRGRQGADGPDAADGSAPARAQGNLWNPLAGAVSTFYDNITDWRASTDSFRVPHKPDSYILISAGNDGFYGTDDDIYNFQR